jgi:hypothetical protein
MVGLTTGKCVAERAMLERSASKLKLKMGQGYEQP